MRTVRRTLLTFVLMVLAAAGPPTFAQAATSQPAWRVSVSSQPTNFAPGAVNADRLPEYFVTASNVGAAPTNGPITITDTLPVGVTPIAATADGYGYRFQPSCDITGQTVTCTSSPTDSVYPGQYVQVLIAVDVDVLPEGSAVSNSAAIAGGGAESTEATTTTTISSAPAPFAFLPAPSGLGASLTDIDGSPVTQAGAHPSQLTVNIGLQSVQNSFLLNAAGGGPRDIHTDLPRGMVVDPSATPERCTESQLENVHLGCPDDSQVGVVGVVTPVVGGFGVSSSTVPLYNMVPPPNAPAELGFDAIGAGIYIHLLGGVRAGDYALTASADDILSRSFEPILGIQAQLWGDPSAASHDAMRGHCAFEGLLGCSVARRSTPFLTMPGACSDALSLHASADSWKDPGNFVDRSANLTDLSGQTSGVAGCSQLDFNPKVALRPTTDDADASSGMDVDLQVPQTDDLESLAEANLKKAVVTLPEGMALNPSAADGLGGCTEGQIGVTSESPIQFDASDPTCPGSAKVGTATVTTPLLPDPLQGALYVADPNDNPFHTLLSGYLVLQGQGITLKLAGRFDRDPNTGQITATFDDNPQLPFSDLSLHFKGGDRGVLVTPPTCGTSSTESQLSPWSAADPDHPTATETKSLVSSFAITSGPDGGACPDLSDPARFTPGFSAGTVSPQAGAYSPFVLKVSRADGEQSLKKVAVTLPLGLTAKLAGVPRCGQSAIVPGVGGSTSCPAGSQVGTVTVSAGAGSSPFFLQDQPVYLTDGYDGAPFGLVIDAHAVAGPFDLGHVVVRTKLNIDPITTQVSADAEPLPSIIQGIPLHIRSVTLKMDRSSFVLNPTSCAAQTVAGQITGGGASFADPGDDTVKGVSSPFQVGGCSDLGLSPKLAISLTGKGQTTDDKHPGVHATVSQTASQSNLKKVVVSLPLSLALDPDNANGLCEFADGSKVDPTCPKASIVGKATARTPILDQPLSGPVYFVKNIRKDPKSGREIRTLPKLVIPLTGENGLRLNLVGTSNVVNNRLVTTFDNIPDAPVSDFTLDIAGGKGGILVVSGTDICKSTQVADQQIDGQNGKTQTAKITLGTPCGLGIVGSSHTSTSLKLTVGGIGAGKLSVSGKGIAKTSRTITGATTATLTARLSKAAASRLKHHHDVRVAVTVSFTPKGAKKAKVTRKTITIHGASKSVKQ